MNKSIIEKLSKLIIKGSELGKEDAKLILLEVLNYIDILNLPNIIEVEVFEDIHKKYNQSIILFNHAKYIDNLDEKVKEFESLLHDYEFEFLLVQLATLGPQTRYFLENPHFNDHAINSFGMNSFTYEEFYNDLKKVIGDDLK